MRTIESPDPAAIFAIATSLSREFFESADDKGVQELSDRHAGIDGFMRATMQVAARFELWACENVRFSDLPMIWPYLLHDRFGAACRLVLRADQLCAFDADDCRLIAQILGLPIVGNSAGTTLS